MGCKLSSAVAAPPPQAEVLPLHGDSLPTPEITCPAGRQRRCSLTPCMVIVSQHLEQLRLPVLPTPHSRCPPRLLLEAVPHRPQGVMVQASQGGASDGRHPGDWVDRVPAAVRVDHCAGAGACVHPGCVCVHSELCVYWSLPDRGGRLMGVQVYSRSVFRHCGSN